MRLCGFMLLLQQGLVLAAASRSLKLTFPYVPPAPVVVHPMSTPQSNSHVHAAPMPMGRGVAAVPVPAWHPTPVPPSVQQAGAQHMRMAAPGTATHAQPTAAIPFAPAIPYNPNSAYRQLPQQVIQAEPTPASAATSGPIPESHPVGMPAPSMPAPAGRPWSWANLINTGAQALSSLAKRYWQQQQQQTGSDGQVALGATADELPTSGGSANSPGPGGPQQWQQSYVSTAAVPSVQPAAVPSVTPVATAAKVFAAPWSNNVLPQQWQQPQSQWQQPQSMTQQAQGNQAVVTAAARSAPQQWAAAPAARQVASGAATGVMSDLSRSRLSGSVQVQQLMPSSGVTPAEATPAGRTREAVMVVGQPAMQPLAPGVTSMAKNNMGAPVAGPLGGPTYMMQPAAAVPAAAAGTGKVSAAAVGSFSSAPAPAVAGSGLGSVQQHFAGPKPPEYAPLSPTLHVAPPKGSKGRGSSVGPSIDDLSDATGAPVAQVTWQLPKKVHVGFAPAADMLRAAPVSPFELPSSMKNDESASQASKGAVTHHLTPTWVPAA